MLKKYIQNIVKSEFQDKELEYFYKNLPSSNTLLQWEKEHEELKEKIRFLKQDKLYLKERLDKEKSLSHSINTSYFNNLVDSKNIEILTLQEENENFKKIIDKQSQDYLALSNKTEKLKESIENLEGKLILKGNLLSEQKQENEKLKKENKQLKNLSCSIVINNEGKLDSLFNQNLKQDNEKLQIKVDKYYNKFLSEGIKKEKAQNLIRQLKKEVDLQGFDQDDFFSPEQTFYRIKQILNEE